MTQTIIKVPAAGAFDPTDITLTDNTSGALLIKEGSNEYMRIDTTNGSELNQLKMPFTTGEFKYIQETSAGPYPFIKCNATSARLFPGSDGSGFNFNRVEVTTSHVHLTGSGSEVRMGASLPVSGSGARAFPAAGHSWTELLTTGSTSKIQRVSDGLKILEVNTDTDSTFTLDDSAGGIFKVQDDAGTPNEFLKIDSDTSASLIEFNVPSGQGAGMTVNLPADGTSGNPNTGFQILPPSGSFKFGRQATGIYSGGTGLLVDVGAGKQLTLTGAQYRFTTSTTPIIFNLNDASGGSLQITDAADNEILKVEQDSNFTHTLDSSITSNFKVVDDAGAPVTYLDIERGLTERVKIPVVGLETIRAIGGNYVAGVSNTTGINLNTFPLNYANTLLTFDQTDDGTTSNQSTKPGLTVVYSSSATGAATSSGITLQLGAGVPADGTTSPQYLVMHNQNATHSVKFILDGSGFYNGHEVATSGSDAADLIGAGFTLAAGKFAVFSILACRVTNTGDHYFYAVSLHTKT